MGFFTAIATAVLWTGASALTVGLVAAGLAVATSLVVGKLLAPDIPESPEQATGGRVQLSPDTTNKLPVLYGSSYLKPMIIDAKISNDNKKMWYVLAFSEVPDSGTVTFTDPSNPSYPLVYWGDRRIQFNTDKITAFGLFDEANNTSDTKISGKIKVYCYPNGSNSGQFGAPAAWTILSQSNIQATNKLWSTSDTMDKASFMIVELEYDQENSLTSLPTITANLKCTLTKPGSVMLDYLKNERYGCGMPAGLVDTQSFLNLDTYSDTLITYTETDKKTNFTTEKTVNRYSINGAVPTSKQCLTNLQTLAKCADSWIQWNETIGKWSIIINQSYSQSGKTVDQLYALYADTVFADTGTMTPAANHGYIIGGVQINPSQLSDTYNKIEIQHVLGKVKDVTGYEYYSINDSLLGPNEPENIFTLSLPFINDPGQAKYLGARKLAQSREDLVISCSVDHSGMQIDAGDVVRVYHKHYGWSASAGLPNGKLFRVSEVRETKNTDGNIVLELTMFEYNDNIYGNLDISTFVPVANTGMGNPDQISTPIAPIITNITTTAKMPEFTVSAQVPSTGLVRGMEFWYVLSASAPTSISQFSRYSVELNKLKNTFDNDQVVTIQVTELPEVPSGSAYYWVVRAIGINGVASQFSPVSNQFNWQPQPIMTPVGLSFTGTFSTNTITVPWTGSAFDYTGVEFKLYGSLGSLPIPFNPTQSTATLGNEQWMILNSSVVKDDITIGNPSAGPSNEYAYWNNVTNVNNNAGYLTVPIIYKDAIGDIYNIPGPLITVIKQSIGSPGQTVDISGFTAFNQSVAGVFTPPNATLSALTTNIIGANYAWTITGATPTSATTPTVTITPNSQAANVTVTLSVTGSNLSTAISKTVKMPVVYDGQPGQTGANGLMNAFPTIYQWTGTSTPPARPTTTTTYTWANGTWTAPAGWNSQTPSNTAEGQYLWEITIPLTVPGSTVTSTLDWTNTQYAIRATAYNGTVGAAGAPGTSGTSGSATFVITRTSGTGAPVNGEVSAVIGRNPVNGDIATVTATSTGTSAVYRFVAGSWAVQANYITGSLIVQNTITADKMSINSLSALSANMGTITAGTIRLPASGNSYLIIDGGSNRMDIYNSGVLRVRIGYLL